MNDMNWLAIYPEILLLAMGCVVALVDLWVTDEQRRPTYWLTQLTLVIVAGLHFSYYSAGLTTMPCMAWSSPTRWGICWPASPASRR
jgi:NADH-quinone oxidoreductase subunit N